MARQAMGGLITGTIGNLTFYEMGGKFYVRAKSTMTKKKMKRNPAFKRLWEHMEVFGNASSMASKMYYRLIPKEKRYNGLFGKVCTEVCKMLKEGKGKEEIERMVVGRVGEGGGEGGGKVTRFTVY